MENTSLVQTLKDTVRPILNSPFRTDLQKYAGDVLLFVGAPNTDNLLKLTERCDKECSNPNYMPFVQEMLRNSNNLANTGCYTLSEADSSQDIFGINVYGKPGHRLGFLFISDPEAKSRNEYAINESSIAGKKIFSTEFGKGIVKRTPVSSPVELVPGIVYMNRKGKLKLTEIIVNDGDTAPLSLAFRMYKKPFHFASGLRGASFGKPQFVQPISPGKSQPEYFPTNRVLKLNARILTSQ